MEQQNLSASLAAVARNKAVFHEPPKYLPSGDDDVSGRGRWRIWEFAGTKVDAPILGNGDLLAAFAGPPKWPQFWITTNDFWQMESGANWEFFHDNDVAKHDPPVSLGSPRPVGRMVFDIPALEGAEYQAEQDFFTATTSAVYTAKNGQTLKLKSWVSATENLLVVEFEPSAPTEISFDFFFPDEVGKGCDVGVDFSGSGETEISLQGTYVGLVGGQPLQLKKVRGGVLSGYRQFADKVDVPTKVGFAGRFLDADSTTVTAEPGKPCCFVLPVRSWAKVSRPYEYARSRAGWITPHEIEELREQHLLWWKDFWSVSGVMLDDPLIEQRYYLSQYVLASVSRDPDYPPNILGICTFDRMAWNGNYKINYNHQSPYLGLLASGHFEQADPHDKPYFDMMDIAREMSRRLLGHEGTYLPLGLGPAGMVSEPLLLYMKSPAVHGATNMIMRYQLTKDRNYAKRVYPFLLSVADFWENDLVQQDGAYRVIGDGMHERVTKNVQENGLPENPSNTLGYLKAFFRFMPEISADLGLDECRREKWREIADHLCDYPVGTIAQIQENPTLWAESNARLTDLVPPEWQDKPVFYDEDKGGKWSLHFPGNIMQIYPAGVIGLDSPSEELEIARNTVHIHSLIEDNLAEYRKQHDDIRKPNSEDPHFYKAGAWNAGNLSCLFFPAAVRVGYDPEVIWHELSTRIQHRGMPNGFIEKNPHGIENLSTVPNTIQEMMLLSHENVLRLFRVWPRQSHPNASFEKLWAYGAFQVSAALKDGVVGDVTILSHKGNSCTLENPWPGKTVRIFHSFAQKWEEFSGERVTFQTLPGEILTICPGE